MIYALDRKQKNNSITFYQIVRLTLIIILINDPFLPASSQGLSVYNNQPSLLQTENNYLNPVVNTKKNFWRATAEWTLVQLLPWASNYYIRRADFARISLNTIANNFKTSEWDDNNFFNNQFSHPYQGSLYFNSFRSNGYNFWESTPAVVAGSFIWETMLEKNPPSPNDIINTSFGGIIFGEMTNRLSKVILRRKAGKKKGLREPAAFVINPMQGLSRLMDKDFRKPMEPSFSNDPPVALVSDAGVRFISKNGKYLQTKSAPEAFGRIQLQYGDPYKQFKEPFSNFSLVAEFGSSDTSVVNTLQIEASIYGKKIKENTKSDYVFNISMNYDLFQNSAFRYGAQSLNANLLSAFNISKDFQVQVKTGTGIILLAAVPNTYMYIGDGRCYDYCSGISFQGAVGINIANKLFYDFNYSGGRTITLNGYQANHRYYTTVSALRVVIYKGLTFIVTNSNHFFNGYYKQYPIIYDRSLFRSFGLGYKVIF